MITVVDLRWPKIEGFTRINVSRMATKLDDEHCKALGNPYKPTTPGSTLMDYEEWVREMRMDEIAKLKDRMENLELACWCKGADTCHANIVRKLILED